MILAWIEARIHIIFYTIAALCIIAIGYLIWHERGIHDDLDAAKQITAQKVADVTACNKVQAITQETNDALQKDRNAIDTRLHALLMQHPATCVPVTGRADVGRPRQQLPNGNGISSSWLRSQAARCELSRQTALSCEAFVHAERQK